MRTVAALLGSALVLTACGGGGSQTTVWRSLRSVRVTVAQPGLPPPYGQPQTTSFLSPAEVARVTGALNNFHISERVPPSSSVGCSGGIEIDITVVPQHGRTVDLSAYSCGGRTYGGIAGDLEGFLASLGLSG